MMVFVAVVGVAMGVGVALQDRQQRFKEISDHHDEAQIFYARRCGSAFLHEDAVCAEFQEKEYPPSKGGKHFHSFGGLMSKHDRRWQSYHLEMTKKYGLAALSPWLPVEADPPVPPGPDRPDK